LGYHSTFTNKAGISALTSALSINPIHNFDDKRLINHVIIYDNTDTFLKSMGIIRVGPFYDGPETAGHEWIIKNRWRYMRYKKPHYATQD